MAWLLALWSGASTYACRTGSQARLGPVLLGAVLGLGLIFALISTQAMPVDPSEVGKSQMLIVIMIVGVVVCAALSTFTARATLRQYGERRS